jgi:myo-inositol-1(or 4)-monophosphatase
LPEPDHGPEDGPVHGPDPLADLALLALTALEAGALALGYVGSPGAVREKPEGLGPVSEADLAVDRLLRDRLLAARPGYGWLSEESEDGPARLGAGRVFVVDPIDGTRAFLAGERAWSHALAVVEAARVVAGVVHLPALGKTYAAARGHGATRNGAAIAASGRAALDGSRLLAAGSQLDARFWPGGAPRVERLFRPSIAYRLCLVADGTADGMVTFRETWEWDLAAGALIAAEAGAMVTDARGAAVAYNRAHPAVPGVLAAAPGVHRALLARLGAAAGEGSAP